MIHCEKHNKEKWNRKDMREFVRDFAKKAKQLTHQKEII